MEQKILELIEKYKKIIIARHIGGDPDALGSTFALKEIILNNFVDKEVCVVGTPIAKFKYFGSHDKVTDELIENALLIVLDVPDIKRIDGIDITRFSDIIKIDHHPELDKYTNIKLIDVNSSSTCEIIAKMCYKLNLSIPNKAAENLFMGIVADTNRFLFSYTSSKTFSLVSKLIHETNFDFVSTYNDLYLRPVKEVKFEGYIVNNMTITDNGFAYLKITQEMLDLFGVDAATAGNMVNNFNYIDEILAWAVFTVDNNNGGTIRGNIRSRGPVINEVAASYGGGGHKLASGVRLKSFDEVDNIVADLDKVCADFK